MSTSQFHKHSRDKASRPLQSQNGNSDTQTANRIQPTGEQLRIAQITSDRSDTDPEMMKKIKEVSDITGRSADEAWTALHDCNGDVEQAVGLLFDKKDGDNDEWQEKKKKKKTAITSKSQISDTVTSENKSEKTDLEIERTENIPKGQRERDRAPPRFQRGRGRGFNHNTNGEKDSSASREHCGGAERRFEGGRGRRRGTGNAGGIGRNQGGRSFSSNTGFESVTHIDTWSNDTAQNGKSSTGIGAWNSDMNEEWTADEWSGSLEESLVLTRTMPTHTDVFSTAAAASNANSQTLQSQVFVASSRANIGDSVGDAYHHSVQNSVDQNLRSAGNFGLNQLMPKFSDSYSRTREEESAPYLMSHFAKEATECIKNAVGIGNSSLSSHGGAIEMDQLVRSSPLNNAQPVNRMKQQSQQHHQMQQQQQQQQQQQRPRLPPPSKIPSSAVEMPGSMTNAQLDVEFGNWDMPSSSSSSNEVSNFLADASQSTQFVNPSVNMPQSPALNLSKSSKAVGDMSMSMHKQSSGLNESSPAAVLAMQELTLGSKSSAYQTNAATNKDLGIANKMVSQQHVTFSSSADDRKNISYSSQQPSNQLTGQSSHLGLSQLAYSTGIESPSSMYKPSSTVSSFSQSSSISQHMQVPVPYGSNMLQQATNQQTLHANYPATQQTQVPYSYSVGHAPASYSVTQAPVAAAFSNPSKSYGTVSDKQTGSYPSVLSQVYDSNSMVNAYPIAGNQSGTGMQQMAAYQSNAIYQGTGGLSYDGLTAAAAAAAAANNYENPANLYRASQQINSSEFQNESFARNTQHAAAAAVLTKSSDKLIDGLSKLSVKDSGNMNVTPQFDTKSTNQATSSLASTNGASPVSAGLVQTQNTTAKTSTIQTTKSTMASKTAVSWPPGVPAPMMNINPNYMIGQPPGFQLATFGYPTAQQTLPYSYEDLQVFQQRYALQPAAAYYDMPVQGTANVPGRDMQATLTTASYGAGSDVKLTPQMDPSLAVQPSQQAQTATANQQSYPTALHPGYGYYYPGAPGIVPMGSYYTPMIPMGGMAVPMATNPTHGVTTSSTQYQKPALYGSHSFGVGGQSQDFSKTFNQASVKGTGNTTGVTPSEMVVAGNAFGKSHVPGFDKVGFHAGTPPPTSFSLALASGTQAGAMGQPAIYGGAYVPMVPHQSHSQMLHHAMTPQESSMVGRGGAQVNPVQSKVGSNKAYNTTYWASN